MRLLIWHGPDGYRLCGRSVAIGQVQLARRRRRIAIGQYQLTRLARVAIGQHPLTRRSTRASAGLHTGPRLQIHRPGLVAIRATV